MYDLSLSNNEINFNSLEKKIYKYACAEACRLIKEVLSHNVINLSCYKFAFINYSQRLYLYLC